MSRRRPFNPIPYLLLTSLVVLAVTLAPSASARGDRTGKANLIPFRHHGPQLLCMVSPSCARSLTNALEIVGNVGLFLPFGALVGAALDRGRRARSRVWWAFAAGLALSLFIEATQFWLPTRYADVDDVILNSSGALLGALLAPLLLAGLERLPRQRRIRARQPRPQRLTDTPLPAYSSAPLPSRAFRPMRRPMR